MFTKLITRPLQRGTITWSKQSFHNHRFNSTYTNKPKQNFSWLGKGALLGAGVFIAQTYVQSDDDPGNLKKALC